MASANYHTLVAPTLFSDVDGRYVGLDGQVHTAPAGQFAYSTFSTWDTYRALHPWLILTQPAQAKKLIDDIIRQTQQSAYGPPVWTLQGKETGIMIGWHGTPIMAEAMVKGIPADYAAAWPGIAKRSFDFSAPDMDN